MSLRDEIADLLDMTAKTSDVGLAAATEGPQAVSTEQAVELLYAQYAAVREALLRLADAIASS